MTRNDGRTAHAQGGSPPTTPGVEPVFPGGQRTLSDVELRDVSPRRSEWLTDLTEQLIPLAARAVRERALDVHEDALSDTRFLGGVVDELEAAGITAQRGVIASVLTDYAVRYLDEDLDPTVPISANDEYVQQYHEHVRDELHDQLTTTGTGSGAWPGDLDELREGLLAALSLRERVPRVRLYLDAGEWVDVEDVRTGQRALEAIRLFAEVAHVELVVSSTKLARVLGERFDFSDVVEFTDAVDAARSGGPTTDDHERDLEADAWAVLDDEYDDGHGDLRILASIPEDGFRWQSALSDDPDVDLRKAGVSRALSRLEDHELITRPTGENGQKKAVLTPLGRAAQSLLTVDCGLRDPLQSTLLGEFTATSRVSAGAVYRAQQGREGGTPAPTAEEWLSSRAVVEEEHQFVRWLDGPTGRLDALGMHKRYVAAARGDISLVDDRWLTEFEDGRVAFLSAFDDEVLVMSQWGGPLPTLARLASTLLSDKALSKLLGPERLGREFEKLQTGDGDRILHAFDEALTAVMRDGMQLGWFGEDEHEWSGWRERIGGVRANCLSRLAKLIGGTDWDARGDLLSDLRGLIGSAVQLYRAAGMDIVVNIRCPDTNNIERDDRRLRDFCDFFKHTVPLTAAYESSTGVHSHYRQVHETREEKVKWRLPVGFDDSNPASENSVQWVVSGRTATDLQPHIESSMNPDVRDRVEDGVEDAPHLDVVVANGCTLPALRDVVCEFARKKGKRVDDGDVTRADAPPKADMDRLIRVLTSALGTGNRPHMANPCDVAEAMMYLASSSRVNDYLTVEDLEYALSQLPAERLFPDVMPTASRMVSALLASDEPMVMSEIVEVAGISESSYHRHLDTLEAVGLLQRTEVNGRTAWLSTLEPWFGTGSDRSEPRGERTESSLEAGMTEADVAFDLVCELGLDVDPGLFAWPPELDEVYRDPDLREWRAWIWAHTAPRDALTTGPPDTPSVLSPRAVRLGYREERRDSDQHSLASSLESGVKVTDGGRERSQ